MSDIGNPMTDEKMRAALERIATTFERDIKQGYSSADKRFAIDIARQALASVPVDQDDWSAGREDCDGNELVTIRADDLERLSGIAKMLRKSIYDLQCSRMAGENLEALDTALAALRTRSNEDSGRGEAVCKSCHEKLGDAHAKYCIHSKPGEPWVRAAQCVFATPTEDVVEQIMLSGLRQEGPYVFSYAETEQKVRAALTSKAVALPGMVMVREAFFNLIADASTWEEQPDEGGIYYKLEFDHNSLVPLIEALGIHQQTATMVMIDGEPFPSLESPAEAIERAMLSAVPTPEGE